MAYHGQPDRSARRRRRVLPSLLAVPLVVLALIAAPAAPAAVAQDPVVDDGTTIISPTELLLDDAQRGRKAIRQLGDQLAVAAARNELRPAELRDLLRTDASVWVDPEGLVYFVDSMASAPSAEEAPTAAAAPLTETFALHSNPGASLTILLDFDGASVSGTAWNEHAGVTPGDHPAWDPAGNGAAHSDNELLMIQKVWAMVAEDYAPFDVDVTTEDPGEAGMVRSSSGDGVYGTRVLVTPSDDPFLKICDRSCGGVAYIKVFDRIGTYNQPAWVFPQTLGNDPKSVAEAATHEAGHNLGLDHDGTSTQGYYAGHGAWAPIMGSGYGRPLVQWSRGSYPGADNQQDDLRVISGFLGVRPDEAAASPATPSLLAGGEAVIGSSDDVDAYLLGTCAAGAVVDVLPAAVGPNLDVRAVLYDSAGTQRSVSQPTSGFGDGTTGSGLGGSLAVPSAGAGWVLTVDGSGEDSWTTNGYDDYGSLGVYTVSAPGCDGEPAVGVPGGPGGVALGGAEADSLTLTWSAPADPGDGPVTGYVVSRSGTSTTEPLGADARSHTFTGLAAATSYELSVRAVNATGAGTPVTISARTTEPPPVLPSAPRDLTGSYDQATGQLQAWWTEPEDSGTQPVNGYAISLDDVPVGSLDAASRGVDISRDAGFGEGQYVVGVAAVNGVGSSPVATVTITVEHPDRPANDGVADAEVLAGGGGSTVGDNTLATREPTDPTPPSEYVAGGYSVWYSWTPTSGGPVTVGTSGGGSDRDTTLGVYTGQPGALVEVAGGDDAVGLHAAVTFDADAGTRYLMAVDGFTTVGGTGPFTLAWSQQVARAPSAPTGVSAGAGDTSASVTWTASDDNGSPVTGYTVTASPGGRTCATTGALSCTVDGLTNGTAYSFVVRATNVVGDGDPSQPSRSVTPEAPPEPDPVAAAPSQMRPPGVVVRGNRAVVTWKAAQPNGSQVTRYLVDISKGRDQAVDGEIRRAVFKRLATGRYRIRVAARNAEGTSPFSGWVRIRIR